MSSFYSDQKESDISFYYRGPFLDRFTNTIIDISAGAITPHQIPSSVNRKLSYLMVECFQNILRHGESRDDTTSRLRDNGIFGFRKMSEHFIIHSVNLLPAAKSTVLCEIIDNVNSMDPDRLKEMQMHQLMTSRLDEKGGAGLGIIEIARKSGQPLRYIIEDAGGGLSYFHQQISVNTGNQKSTPAEMIGETREIYQKMAEENIFLSYKGDFSQKSILPILDLVQHNISEANEMGKNGRKIGHVLIELLQNISKHGWTRPNDSKEGIFLIGKKEDHAFILVANVINSADAPFIEEKMDYLTSLDDEELRQLHKSALRASVKFENKHKSGLGLIEVARIASAPLKYIFEPVGDHLLLFSMYVRI
ncbi:MAG: hypothetical protein IT223_01030 [Crocinitomicaceae bacterium]|nr:hypothetical protein [Crocinitomicaceae bacterium]